MKKILLYHIFFLFITVQSFAQTRTIARGATAGELYMTTECYGIAHGVGYDTILYALLHFTENGKNAEMVYSINYLEKDKMQPEVVLTDATAGVVYIHDRYMKNFYDYDRLWVSFDYGKTWELRDEPEYDSNYSAANFEGLIYKGGGVYKSINNGYMWDLLHEKYYNFLGETYFKECEFFDISGSYPNDPWALYYTNDCFDTYSVIPIGEEYVFGLANGRFPDVFRGSKEGEIYITSWFPDKTYKVSFGSDAGYNFRVVYHSEPVLNESNLLFMSDRKAGDFYIVKHSGRIFTYNPYGFYTRICIEHYTDYGETLAGTYCHYLTRQGVVTEIAPCLAVSNLTATQQEGNVLLKWSAAEAYLKEYKIFVDGVEVATIEDTEYLFENLEAGTYTFGVKAVYWEVCEPVMASINFEVKVGINERNISELIVIYPNPTNGQLTMDNGQWTITDIEIIDVYGRKLSSHHLITSSYSHVINVSHLPAGIYFMRIQTDNGVVTKKIIKQ